MYLRKLFIIGVFFLIFSESGFAEDSFSGEYSEFESKDTPLLPHPAPARKKPIYSQDKYREVPETEDVTDDITEPKYSQDRFKKKVEDKRGNGLRNTTDPKHEKSEAEIAQGILRLEEGNLAGAELHFNRALESEKENFLAHEYLAQVFERKKDYTTATVELVKAKHLAPRARYSLLNSQIGRLYYLAGNKERAMIYLNLARKEGSLTASTNYLMGFIEYQDKNYLSAEEFFRKAKNEILSLPESSSERDLLQAIYFYLGEINAREGYYTHSVSQLRQTEYGNSAEIRNSAWRLHSLLNQSSWNARFGFGAQLDSNVILLPQKGTLPIEYSSKASPATVLFGGAHYSTSPTKTFRFSGNLNLQMNNYFSEGLEGYDFFSADVGAILDYWNKKTWGLRLKYDFFQAHVDRNKFDRFQTNHTPSFSFRYFPYQRWVYELGGKIQTQDFGRDIASGPDRRHGSLYSAFFKTVLEAPTPAFRPGFFYAYEIGSADGENFRSVGHVLSVDVLWSLSKNVTFYPGAKLRLTNYPDHLFGRKDTTTEVSGQLSYRFAQHWALHLGATLVKNVSSLRDFEYDRFVGSSALSFQLN